MRSTLVMNDFSEVRHGFECLSQAYKAEAGRQLDSSIERIYPGLPSEIKAIFASWVPHFRQDTFVTCISEHDRLEDKYGRLSMWRAYGGNSGVAIILNGDVCFRPSDALGAYTYPVAYIDEDGLAAHLKEVALQFEENEQFIRKIGREATRNAMFSLLRSATVCTKHPAFKEEREWRIVASPRLTPTPRLTQSIETIGGIPQEVLKIPLKNFPDQGLFGVEPNEFIERILIGPSEHSDVVRRALLAELIGAKVADPEAKIYVTGIPLRANQH